MKPQLFKSLKGYNKKDLLNDLFAGLMVAIIALPLSIALAIASGVSPEKGLYTAIVAGVFGIPGISMMLMLQITI